MYDRYDSHCRYFGIVSKLTKKPLKRRTGMEVTGPRNTATYNSKATQKINTLRTRMH